MQIKVRWNVKLKMALAAAAMMIFCLLDSLVILVSYFPPLCPGGRGTTTWMGLGHVVAAQGNFNTFTLLQGTEYMPDLHNGILFVESAEENTSHDFARDLASLLQVAKNPKGLVIG